MAENASVPGNTTPPPDTPVGLAASLLAVVTTLVFETALVALAATERLTMVWALAGHCVIVCLLLAVVHRRLLSGADGGFALLAVIGTFATGPFGAFGALLIPILGRRHAASEALLPAWYARIALSSEQDSFTRLSDRVAIGRAANLAAALPQPFVKLFETGTIADQQTALGMIARTFHPGYLPVLKLALDSPEPVIRVQAAAVAARVRGQLNEHTLSLFARAADPTLLPDMALDVASELRAAIDSGLLEAAHQNKAGDIVEGLLGRTFARLDTRRRSPSVDRAAIERQGSEEVTEAYAAHLLANGRFDDFRSLRLSVRRPVHGRFRHRLVRAPRATAALRRQLVSISVRP